MKNANLQKAIDFCVEKVDVCLKTAENAYPHSASENLVYGVHDNNNADWTQGFWTGMLWLAYEFTGDEKYKNAAMWQAGDFYNRVVNKVGIEHHDMGFLYSPSCVYAYRLTGDETAKKAAIMAADYLASRFQEVGQFIQAWGELGAKDNYRLIIDCMMNVPLLFWASEVTGDDKYKNIAEKHIATTAKVIIRDDGTTYHTFYFDNETGEPLSGVTHQGYSNDSIWARGQAWGVYGFALAYKHTGKKEYIEKFLQVTKVFLDHLPEDDVPAWDMIFTDTKTQKDTSAAPIAICGILEMARLTDIPAEFTEKAEAMMSALADYHTPERSNGILKAAVYSMNHDNGVDECNIWGDYYYMEALMRLKNEDYISCWE